MDPIEVRLAFQSYICLEYLDLPWLFLLFLDCRKAELPFAALWHLGIVSKRSHPYKTRPREVAEQRDGWLWRSLPADGPVSAIQWLPGSPTCAIQPASTAAATESNTAWYAPAWDMHQDRRLRGHDRTLPF